MSDLSEILNDTIQALEELKRSGVTHVEVSRTTLDELGRCSGVRPGRVSAEAAVTAATTTDSVAAELAGIEARAKACVKCSELARCRTNVVFGVGSPHAELKIGRASCRERVYSSV